MGKQRRSSPREKRRNSKDGSRQINQTFSMSNIEPMTLRQEDMFDAYYEGSSLAAIGSAGTGKTMCALYLALSEVLEKSEYRQVIIVRSAVQTRDQGHQPGNKEQKEAVYSDPYIGILNDLFGRDDAYQILVAKKIIKFVTTSFIRGITCDNAIIIADECQSMNFHELDTVITRSGKYTKVILCGDTMQDDLAYSRNRADTSGLKEFLNIINMMDSFETIKFTSQDCVRGGLSKEYLLKKESYYENIIAA